MLDILVRLLFRRAAFSFEKKVWELAGKHKKFDKFVRSVIKILEFIVMLFVAVVLIAACWFFYLYFSGKL